MVSSPKFPRNCDSEYMLDDKRRRIFICQDCLLRIPVSSFSDLSCLIDSIPEEKSMNLDPYNVYNDIKTALYKMITNKDQSVALSTEINSYIEKVYSYLSTRKIKEKFIKDYKHEVEANEPRLNERKISKARQDTFLKAQLLGTALTNKGLDEFEDEYITNPAESTSSTTNEFITTNTIASPDIEEQITSVPSIKKSCTLEKNNKKFVIYNPIAYLTSPNKPKIQYCDRENVKEFCTIGMEFLLNDESSGDNEAMEEYKSYANDQDKLISSDHFPVVDEFIRDIIQFDFKDLPQKLWNHEKRIAAEGPTRILMDIICYTLTDFHSNCKQELKDTNNYERSAFVKYVVPMLKYFSQETNLIEICWCEKGLDTHEVASLEKNDFMISCMDRRYSDALGKNTTSDEEFFVESSSGFEKEKIKHSLDDTLKLMIECSNSLHHIIKNNKKAGIDTMTKKCTLGVQVIKQTMTLTKMILSKSGKWKLVELRSAQVPTTWELRSRWNPLFEMLATIYVELKEQRKLDNVIMNEVSRLTKLSSKSVLEHFLMK